MKYIKIKFLGITTLILGLSSPKAQEAILTTGGNASGTGGSINYSIGQINYISSNVENGFIIEGVQQPYEISEVTSIIESEGIILSCSVYPNPTSSFIQLKFDSLNLEDLIIKIFDVNGKILKTEEQVNIITKIEMNSYISGIYYLTVAQNNQDIKTFKIVKN